MATWSGRVGLVTEELPVQSHYTRLDGRPLGPDPDLATGGDHLIRVMSTHTAQRDDGRGKR